MNTVKTIAAVFLLATCSPFVLAEANNNLVIYETKGEFADVREDLIDAIISQGLVIDYNGRPGDMLKRTQADVGGSKDLYRAAEYLIFCSALLSRKTMETDIQNISYCPYVVTIYETEQKPGTIYVSYRKFSRAADQSLLAVENLLDEIAREATR
ncbi:MAG: DUF302 domain-containing protein [Gammaproteobacteria bacterium]|nr:DUF302 domain-containing protein [Gammaproteobacteria bacterium]